VIKSNEQIVTTTVG